MRQAKLVFSIMALAAIVSLFLGASASAGIVPEYPDFQVKVGKRGEEPTTLRPVGVANPDGKTYHYSMNDVAFEGGVIKDFEFDVDPDPMISGDVSVFNPGPLDLDYVFSFVLPTGPIGAPSTLTGGSISGSVTDGTGGDTTFSTIPGEPVYMSKIDGADYVPLHSDPFSVIASGFSSTAIAAASFGTPIPFLPGPPVLASIGIDISFNLTAGGATSITSVFVVEPVPEPSALVLGGIALAGFGLVVRRFRKGR